MLWFLGSLFHSVDGRPLFRKAIILSLLVPGLERRNYLEYLCLYDASSVCYGHQMTRCSATWTVCVLHFKIISILYRERWEFFYLGNNMTFIVVTPLLIQPATVLSIVWCIMSVKGRRCSYTLSGL